uniref:Uncharacterized protein n=1 Tax=Opuntia streptacantha TaxID=393608 RepID=A0A7C9A047_OPUST
MGKEVHVLPGAVTLHSRALAKEAVVFVFELLGRWVSQLALQFVFGAVESLVGTLSGLCPVHQLALQFVELCGSAGWYLEWALPGPPACVCGLTVCGGLLRSLECRVSWLVP